MAGKSPATQPWTLIPGTRHTDETVEGKKMGMRGGGGGGGKMLNELLHRSLNKHSTKNSQILGAYKATTYHVSLHLQDWLLDAS